MRRGTLCRAAADVVDDGALARVLYEPGAAGEVAGLDLGLERFLAGLAYLEGFGGEDRFEPVSGDIDPDEITILQQADQLTLGRFW